MAFSIKPLAVPDVLQISPDVYSDERGFFLESFKESAFAASGIDVTMKQFNHSHSKRHVLRGLHYQLAPHAQAKLLTVVSGTIFDVAVDLRRDSATYGQWASVELSADTHEMVFVPRGFAHGFVVLSDEADVLYYCDAEYTPEAERGIAWNDADLGIKWPVVEPILSGKDLEYPTFKEAEH